MSTIIPSRHAGHSEKRHRRLRRFPWPLLVGQRARLSRIREQREKRLSEITAIRICYTAQSVHVPGAVLAVRLTCRAEPSESVIVSCRKGDGGGHSWSAIGDLHFPASAYVAFVKAGARDWAAGRRVAGDGRRAA